MRRPNAHKGFTVMELLIVLGIFGLLVTAISWILVTSLRSNAVLWEQLATQSDGRRVLQQVVDDVRRAEPSSIGSYPIAYAASTTFTFYANIDTDAGRERVRFFLQTTTLYKGVINPSGAPLSYNEEDEIITVIAEDVKNIEEGNPVFWYYDEDYTGTQEELNEPINVTDVRVVRVELELEEDPTQTPVPLHVESTVHIRNLKDT